MPSDSSGSARGDLVSIEAQHDSPQPYRIVLVGHRFAYELDLLAGSDPPALSDLRLAALDANTPIEKSDLMAVANCHARLAAIAAQFARRDVLTHDHAATERMRAGLSAFGVDADGVTLHSRESPGPVLVPAPKRGRGRPGKSTEFYRRVADAARDAAADPSRRNIAVGVQKRAAHWPECSGVEPPKSTVERWLKRARKLGLYRGPKAQTPNPATTPEETDR
ncbi:MAG: hypothetical protein K0U84_12965 [Actinomycetia bacterium]|nr:hypothetical protein [Actinomycetes bacterium]